MKIALTIHDNEIPKDLCICFDETGIHLSLLFIKIVIRFLKLN